MVSKLISTSVIGVLILLVMGAMVWQVAPVSAGFTPTPSPTATSIPPTVTSTPPTTTSTPPTATSTPPTALPPATSIPPTATSIPPTATPPLLLPPTGGPASGLSNIEAIAIVLAGMVVVLLVFLSLVIRDSARARSG